MKRVRIKIEYKKKQENGADEDTITFSCPYKKYRTTLLRDDIENYTLAEIIDEAEYTCILEDKKFTYSKPLEVVIKMEEEEYKYLFHEFIDYTEDKKHLDLIKIFDTLKWSVVKAYRDISLYEKYVDSVDLDGSIDGCTYCVYYHRNNYCTKFNKIDPVYCTFYKFRSIKIKK